MDQQVAHLGPVAVDHAERIPLSHHSSQHFGRFAGIGELVLLVAPLPLSEQGIAADGQQCDLPRHKFASSRSMWPRTLRVTTLR